MAKKMNCKNCGTILTGTEVFCKSCGQKVEAEPVVNTPVVNDNKEKPKSLFKFFIVLITTTIILIAIAFMFVSGSFDSIKNSASETFSSVSNQKDSEKEIEENEEIEEIEESEKDENSVTLEENQDDIEINHEIEEIYSEDIEMLKQDFEEEILEIEREKQLLAAELEAERLKAEIEEIKIQEELRLEAIRYEEEMKEALKNELKAEIEEELKNQLKAELQATPTPQYNEYILSGSNVRYITSEELKYLSSSQLRIARNEIFARHGRIFQSVDLQEYFSGLSWYFPISQNIELMDLSEIERANVELIQKEETLR